MPRICHRKSATSSDGRAGQGRSRQRLHPHRGGLQTAVWRASQASPLLSSKVEDLLSCLPVLALDGTVDRHCADIRLTLERAGTPTGSHDLFIAAHARSLGLGVVTHNLREFQRVPGLVVEDWLAPTA